MLSLDEEVTGDEHRRRRHRRRRSCRRRQRLRHHAAKNKPIPTKAATKKVSSFNRTMQTDKYEVRVAEDGLAVLFHVRFNKKILRMIMGVEC